MTHTVGIYLYDDVEVLDFAGPCEVFSTASRVRLRLQSGSPEPFAVLAVAGSLRAVRAQVQRMAGWLDLEPGGRLLDVACGPDLLAAEFARRGVSLTGIDFGPAGICTRGAGENRSTKPSRLIKRLSRSGVPGLSSANRATHRRFDIYTPMAYTCCAPMA
jgi:hypothetical protein